MDPGSALTLARDDSRACECSVANTQPLQHIPGLCSRPSPSPPPFAAPQHPPIGL